MKAIVITRYGQPAHVLKVREVSKPVPADDQVLVKVRAGSLNISDLAPIKGALIARLLGTGWLKPKREILGTDLAGQVEAAGRDVTKFKPGDEVFGVAAGSLAEYACAAPSRLALKPSTVTFEAAAAVPVAAVSALQGLRKGGIGPGQRVMVHGASGGVGTFAIQIARALGAEVTAVCSPRNVPNARLLGADHVIDYTRQDFVRNGQAYDLILAVNGDRSPRDYAKALSPQGNCVVLGGSLTQVFKSLLLGPWVSKLSGRTVGFMGIARVNPQDLDDLSELLVAGQLKPLIEKRYALDETAEAAQYLAEGHAQGKLVISVSG